MREAAQGEPVSTAKNTRIECRQSTDRVRGVLPMKMTTTAGSGGGTAAGGSIDDEAFARIKMGVNVDIKRSDGKTSTPIRGRGILLLPSPTTAPGT